MHSKSQKGPLASSDAPPMPRVVDARSGLIRAQVRTVVVRRGSESAAVQVRVPEGSSLLHAGMAHLNQEAHLPSVDDWFVIEE